MNIIKEKIKNHKILQNTTMNMKNRNSAKEIDDNKTREMQKP